MFDDERTESVYVYTTDTNSLLTTEATVSGVKMEVAFDSGATASIISRKVIERLVTGSMSTRRKYESKPSIMKSQR